MTISDYASIKELENEHRDGWGSTTALWVIVAALILFAIVYNWTRNCNEKVQFAVGMARMEGRLNCIEPDVRWAGQQLYAANGAISATVQGVGDMKPMFDKNRNELIQLFDMISQNGIGSILSVKGGMIISKLAKRK